MYIRNLVSMTYDKEVLDRMLDTQLMPHGGHAYAYAYAYAIPLEPAQGAREA
jgi:hypothetical protein